MLGFLLQWPTLLTIVMFPVLIFMYVRLAIKEEKDVEAEFSDEYRRWAAVTPRFIPRLSSLNRKQAQSDSCPTHHRGLTSNAYCTGFYL